MVLKWKWILLAIGVLFVVVIIAQATGTNRKLWKMVKDSITQDQEKIIETLAKDNDQLKKERSEVYADLEKVRKERDAAKIKSKQWEGKYNALKQDFANIVIPTDPDAIVNELHALGLKSAHRYQRK
jgi:dsDNA-specific endonuclease/ATPase MutS2